MIPRINKQNLVKMNILFFSKNQISSRVGGIERVTSIVVPELINLGYNCFSLYINPVDKSFPITKFAKSKRLSSHGDLKKEFKKFLIENEIDVVINQDYSAYCREIKDLIIDNGLNIKTIYFHHVSPGAEIINLNWKYYLSFFKRQNNVIKNIARLVLFPIHKLLNPIKYRHEYKRIYDYNDKIVLLSARYIKPWLKFGKITGDHKLTAINNCLTFPSFYSMDLYNHKKKQVLIVSRLLEGHKDISKALKIWQNIEQDHRYDQWELKIVGHGPDEAFYKKLSGQLKLQRVSFEGPQEPYKYYHNASIFMLTSSYEGWVLTLNEAKQNAIVPIAYDSFAALPEIINNGHDGYIIPFDDLYLYIERLKQLMSDPILRQEMAKNAVESTKRFSKDIIIKDWIKLLETR